MRGFTLIELMIVMAIIMILGVLVIGPMNQQLMMAHETAAVGQIRTIHQAEAQYYAQSGKYAEDLAALGSLIPGGKKSGYSFSVVPTEGGYAVRAVPLKFGSTGRRTFYSDQTLVIQENWDAHSDDLERLR